MLNKSGKVAKVATQAAVRAAARTPSQRTTVSLQNTPPSFPQPSSATVPSATSSQKQQKADAGVSPSASPPTKKQRDDGEANNGHSVAERLSSMAAALATLQAKRENSTLPKMKEVEGKEAKEGIEGRASSGSNRRRIPRPPAPTVRAKTDDSPSATVAAINDSFNAPSSAVSSSLAMTDPSPPLNKEGAKKRSGSNKGRASATVAAPSTSLRKASRSSQSAKDSAASDVAIDGKKTVNKSKGLSANHKNIQNTNNHNKSKRKKSKQASTHASPTVLFFPLQKDRLAAFHYRYTASQINRTVYRFATPPHQAQAREQQHPAQESGGDCASSPLPSSLPRLVFPPLRRLEPFTMAHHPRLIKAGGVVNWRKSMNQLGWRHKEMKRRGGGKEEKDVNAEGVRVIETKSKNSGSANASAPIAAQHTPSYPSLPLMKGLFTVNPLIAFTAVAPSSSAPVAAGGVPTTKTNTRGPYATREQRKAAALAAPFKAFQHKDGTILFSYAMLFDLVSLINPHTKSYSAWRAVMYAIKHPLAAMVARRTAAEAVHAAVAKGAAPHGPISTRNSGRRSGSSRSHGDGDGKPSPSVSKHDKEDAAHERARLEDYDTILFTVWMHFNGITVFDVNAAVENDKALNGSSVPSPLQTMESVRRAEAEAARVIGIGMDGGGQVLAADTVGVNGGLIDPISVRWARRRARDGDFGFIREAPQISASKRTAIAAAYAHMHDGLPIKGEEDAENSLRKAWDSYFPVAALGSEATSLRGDSPRSSFPSSHSFSSLPLVNRYTFRSLLYWAKVDNPLAFNEFVSVHNLTAVLREETIVIPDTARLDQRFLTEGEALSSVMDWLQESPQKALVIQSPYGTGKTSLLKKVFAEPMLRTQCGGANTRLYGDGGFGGDYHRDDDCRDRSAVGGSTANAGAGAAASAEQPVATNAKGEPLYPIKRILFISYRITLSMSTCGSFPGFVTYLDVKEKAMAAALRGDTQRSNTESDQADGPNSAAQRPLGTADEKKAFMALLDESHTLPSSPPPSSPSSPFTLQSSLPSAPDAAEKKKAAGISNGAIADAAAVAPSFPQEKGSLSTASSTAVDDGVPTDIHKCNFLICQVDSLFRVTGCTYDLVVLDEIEGVLNHFSATTMEEKRGELYRIMTEIIQHSNRVICLDGDVDNRTKAFLLQMMGRKHIRYLVNARVLRQLNYQFCSGSAFFEEQMEEALKTPKGETTTAALAPFSSSPSSPSSLDASPQKQYQNIAVICMTMEKALYFQTLFKDRYPTVCYTSASSEEVRRTLQRVNEEWPKYRVIIFSPSIEAGVDFNVPHVDRIFVAIHAASDIRYASTSQRGLSQMIARIRQFTNPNILCYRKHLPLLGPTSTRYRAAEVRELYQSIVSRVHDHCESEGLMEMMHYNKAEELNKVDYLFLPLFVQRVKEKGHTVEIIDDTPFMMEHRRHQRHMARQLRRMAQLADPSPAADAVTLPSTESEKAKARHAYCFERPLTQAIIDCDVSKLMDCSLWEVYWAYTRQFRNAKLAAMCQPTTAANNDGDESTSETPTSEATDNAVLSPPPSVPSSLVLSHARSDEGGLEQHLLDRRKVIESDDSQFIGGWDPMWESSPDAKERVCSLSSTNFVQKAFDAMALAEEEDGRSDTSLSEKLRDKCAILKSMELTQLHVSKLAHTRLFQKFFDDKQTISRYFDRSRNFYDTRQLFHGTAETAASFRNDLRWSEQHQRDHIVTSFLDDASPDWRSLLLTHSSFSVPKVNIDLRKWTDILFAERATLLLGNYKLHTEAGVFKAFKALLSYYFIALKYEEIDKSFFPAPTHRIVVQNGVVTTAAAPSSSSDPPSAPSAETILSAHSAMVKHRNAQRLKYEAEREGSSDPEGWKKFLPPIAPLSHLNLPEANEVGVFVVRLDATISRLLKRREHVELRPRWDDRFFKR